ncbi:hypothetical protein GCM10027022_03380 [Alpinimonas psychrophila]
MCTMIFIELNWLAIVAATVAAFVAGAIWFGPKTFFPVWWKLIGKEAGVDPGANLNMAIVFASTFVGALVQAFTLAVIIHFVAAGDSAFGALAGGVTGLLVGIGLAAASSLGHRLFAGAGFRVWLLEVGSDVVNLTIMGVILGAWR